MSQRNSFMSRAKSLLGGSQRVSNKKTGTSMAEVKDDVPRSGAFVSGNARVVEVIDETPEGFRWLQTNRCNYIDDAGKERAWEFSSRSTHVQGLVDAVYVVPILKYEGDREDEILLVLQFRPPLNSYCLEFPAGLVDKEDSDPGVAALRELKEESGFVGTVRRVSPPAALDSGLSSADMQFVFVEVDMSKPENQNPVTRLEDGEFVESHLIRKSELFKVVADPEKAFGGKKVIVDSRLSGIAFALEFM